jgi:hypothetical protein
MQANLDEEVHQQHVEAGEQEGEHEGEVVAEKVKRVSPRTAAAVRMAACRTTLLVDITQELHDIRHDRKMHCLMFPRALIGVCKDAMR